MAMMHALLAALPVPSPSALLPRHRHSRAHPHTADAALGNFSSFKNAGISHTPIPNSTKCGQMCVLARAASAGGRDARVRANAEEDVSLALASCLEVAEDGSRYLHVMASSMHNVDNGCIIGLTCVPITKGHSSARNLEFPLFLNALAASPIRVAVEKGGLPHALEELGNLNDLDLQKIYVSSFSNVRGGGDFLVLDERTGSRTMVASTFPQGRDAIVVVVFTVLGWSYQRRVEASFPYSMLGRGLQAIAVALRYRQPFFLKLETLLSANGDFIDRMLINPLARDQDGDVEWLAELSKSMHAIVGNQSRLQTGLNYAVDSEQYEEALRLKQELISYNTRMDQEAVNVLQRLRTLYLERMGIFFKL